MGHSTATGRFWLTYLLWKKPIHKRDKARPAIFHPTIHGHSYTAMTSIAVHIIIPLTSTTGPLFGWGMMERIGDQDRVFVARYLKNEIFCVLL